MPVDLRVQAEGHPRAVQDSNHRAGAGGRAGQAGPVDRGRVHQVLPDGQAYGLLTGYCRQPYATAFMLYRLYGNAAAFTAAAQ